MTVPIDIRIKARLEFEAAAVWYEDQQPGVGVKFVDEVNRVLDMISDQPDRFPIVRKDVRAASLRKFPYQIYYRESQRAVRVIAIFHESRNPRILIERAKED